MFKWLINKAPVIGIGIMVIIAILIVPIVTYLIGILALGYVAWRAFHTGKKDAFEIAQTKQKIQSQNSSEDNMLFDTTNSKQVIATLEKEMTKKQEEWVDYTAVVSFNRFTNFLGGFFHSSSKISKSKFSPHELENAALICQQQTSNEQSDIHVITKALNEFNAEGTFLATQNQLKCDTSPNGYHQLFKEEPAFTKSREKEECTRLLAALSELMNNYPQCMFEDNPCVESIESYAIEREAHHEKILAIAAILLPDLSSLLKEAKAANHITMNCGSK